MRKFPIILLIILLAACQGKKKNSSEEPVSRTGDTLAIGYAKGFSIVDYGHYKILEINNPYPGADKSYTYLLFEKNAKVPKGTAYDAKIQIPVQKIVVTSTTHIPSLVSLHEIKTLVGFPHPDFISSKRARQWIDRGKVKDLGQNEQMNTEILLGLKPDVVIGFTLSSDNKAYANIERYGIPVVYDGDWNEKTPLGKAEWIKFFGAFYNKEKEAAAIFDHIKEAYLSAKKLATDAKTKPTVLAGAMFKDVWYLPGGGSWAAKIIADAHADYLFKKSGDTGSLALSFESVLTRARHADYWINPGNYTTYEQLADNSEHYKEFDAFKNKKIYTYAFAKGETGGFTLFELGPNRPDLVLKDLIHIFHPQLLPDYNPVFYRPLQ